MDEGIDDAGQEDGHEEDEHANLLADPLLQLVQVPENKYNKVRLCRLFS